MVIPALLKLAQFGERETLAWGTYLLRPRHIYITAADPLLSVDGSWIKNGWPDWNASMPLQKFPMIEFVTQFNQLVLLAQFNQLVELSNRLNQFSHSWLSSTSWFC